MSAPLSAAEEDRARTMRARAHEIFPELVDVVRDLLRAGLIDGWRNVRFVGTNDEHIAYVATQPPLASCRYKWNEMRQR